LSRLLVVALGGNALATVPSVGTAPNATRSRSYEDERRAAARSVDELVELTHPDDRLIIVHGNGPQVGRLLDQAQSVDDLDVCVAQTQGEIGYLLVQALGLAGLDALALVTRAIVPGTAGLPATKAIGPVHQARPAGSARRHDGGWIRTVPSPEPERIVELDAIRLLAGTHHLVVGGGGGVPLSREGQPVACVIDKDWVAAIIAVELRAEQLIFVTNVDGVRDDAGRLIGDMSTAEAAALVQSRVAQPGSMGPKLESARRYVKSRGRPAVIARLGEVAAGVAGVSGTRIRPSRGQARRLP
jgi:carbamate kinase